MHLVYGDKAVVDWIFKLGERGYLAAAAGRLNQELLAAHHARDVHPERRWQIQAARQARMAVARHMIIKAKIMALNVKEGTCDECSSRVGRQLSLCLVCKRYVCMHCRVPHHLQCWTCRRSTGRDYMQEEPRVDSRLPGNESTSCHGPEPLGQCMWCNRWLCEMCCRTERPVACVTCPAKVENKTPLREAWQG